MCHKKTYSEIIYTRPNALSDRFHLQSIVFIEFKIVNSTSTMAEDYDNRNRIKSIITKRGFMINTLWYRIFLYKKPIFSVGNYTNSNPKLSPISLKNVFVSFLCSLCGLIVLIIKIKKIRLVISLERLTFFGQNLFGLSRMPEIAHSTYAVCKTEVPKE